MTEEQALDNLYKAARQLVTNAETHEILKQSYDILQAKLTEKENELNK